MKKQFIAPTISMILGVALLLPIVFLFTGADNGDSAAADVAGDPNPSPSATVTSTNEACDGSWPMATSDYANNRWFSEGIAEIRDAETAKQAEDAAFVWLEGVRKDPNLLAGAASYFFDQDVDKTTLIDEDSCATEEAVELTIQLDLTLADAQSIIPENAPANGYNSGVNDGEVIAEEEPGVRGDRDAIKIVTKDGDVIWIMARCGNIVTEGKPPLPPGTTDNPKKPERDPYPRGNAPIGGGPNADPGPGTYIPPQEMEQPPTPPRVDPAPPAPEPAPAPPTVTPSPAPSTPPTVDTGEQDNDGTVPEEGGANCNPDFQNCP